MLKVALSSEDARCPTALDSSAEQSVPLGTLKRGARGIVESIMDTGLTTLAPGELERRLLDMGFVENVVVRILHEGPFGGDPIVVQLRTTQVALRRQEANAIRVRPLLQGQLDILSCLR